MIADVEDVGWDDEEGMRRAGGDSYYILSQSGRASSGFVRSGLVGGGEE